MDDNSSNWFRSVCCRILRTGVVPKHVAIIMDGNRRFAKKMHYGKAFQGHVLGFEKLKETLQWCLDLGVTEVTVYAFSIENFKRSKEEVDGLMELTKQKIAYLLEESDVIAKHQVRVRALGDLRRLPDDVMQFIAKGVNYTKHNTRAYLNVCYAYTSRHEMTEAIKEMAMGAQDGLLYPSDISEDLIEQCLYTGDSPPPDLVVRTSGEVRLSDFLLWQSTYSHLCFQDVLWPEFSVWHFFSAVLSYQQSYASIQQARQEDRERRDKHQYESDLRSVLEQRQGDVPDASLLEQMVKEHAERRRERQRTFVERIRTSHAQFLEQLCPAN